jgi:hypothetical protein
VVVSPARPFNERPDALTERPGKCCQGVGNDHPLTDLFIGLSGCRVVPVAFRAKNTNTFCQGVQWGTRTEENSKQRSRAGRSERPARMNAGPSEAVGETGATASGARETFPIR